MEEYEKGATILALAYKYRTDTTAIRKRLDDLGVPIRRAGTIIGVHRLQKLSPEQVQEALQLDEQGMSHMDIGRKLGVTRERIRQICLRAGHQTRRERMDKTIRLQEARMARTQARLQKVAQISEAWRRGFTMRELSILIWGGIKPDIRTASKISHYRKVYGLGLFPYRRPAHWTGMTEVARRARLIKMSEAWKKHPDIASFTKKFGYSTHDSTRQALKRYNKLYPELFPPIKDIVWNR